MRVVALLALAACGGSVDGVTPDIDGGPPGDAPVGCVLGITYTPSTPVAGVDPVVRAVANVNGEAAGAHTYNWILLRNGQLQPTPEPAVPDGSEVEFAIPAEAIYTIAFSIADDPSCLQASAVVDVNSPGTMSVAMRVHVVAPDAERPPLVKSVLVDGGDQDLLDESIQLAAAITVTGNLVTALGAPVAGYVRFMPAIGREAAVETFANPLGDFQVKVRPETHEVLVIPSTPNVPPQLVTWTQQQTVLSLEAGQTVTGVVNNPNGTPLPGATVQISIGGVPSTVATTDGTGNFSLVVMPQAGAAVRIEVTAPVATGLPRLVAESTTFDPAQPVTASYAAGLTTRSLAGTIVQRGGPLANADVSIVGTIAAAGSISAGATVTAAGEVRASATTNGSGALPTLRAPSAPLTAVIFPGAAGDHAVTSIDLTTAAPATINAAATVARTTQLRESTNTTALPGAVLDLVPTGDLALAGAPTIRKTTDESGNLTIDLAPNGTYQLRLTDPNGNRAALKKVPNVTSANFAATHALAKATRVQGLVEGQAAIPGAIVQFLCATCTGLDRSRPEAEGITGIDGRFSLAVADPN